MTIGADLRREFTDYLDQKGYKYMVVDEEDNIVVLGFTGDRDTIDTRIYVDFDERADMHSIACVHFVAQDFAKCADEKVGEVIIKLNDLNKRFRWVKFWLDKSDNTISADADALIFSGSTGEECLDYVLHVSHIVQEGYKELRSLIITDDGGDDDGPSKEELLRMLEMLSGMLGK